jgi:hypothetical protein
MNTLSALEMKLNIGSKEKEAPDFSLRRLLSRPLAQSGLEKGIGRSRNASSNSPDYRLGESVCHGRFGVGQVMALAPDGRLQIRFHGARKSMMIFPSFLDRANT